MHHEFDTESSSDRRKTTETARETEVRPSEDPCEEPLTGAIGTMTTVRTTLRPPIDPTAEEAYWRENFYSRPYVRPGDLWIDFGPAFRLGWQARQRHPLREWRDVEATLERSWRTSRGSRLPWSLARRAARDAWDHLTTWFDDRAEESYWQRRFSERQEPGEHGYDSYRAAFRFGWEAKRRHVHQSWDDAESTVEAEWHELELDRRLPWSEAREAVRDAWRRVEERLARRRD